MSDTNADIEIQMNQLDQPDFEEMAVPGNEYILPRNRARPREKTWKDEDEDESSSLRYFMSEPSLSEDDRSHLPMAGISLPFPQESFSGGDEDEDLDFSRPPHPPGPNIHHTSGQSVSSPGGNTSLSSWDSPHLMGKKVHMHFSTDTRRPRLRVDSPPPPNGPPRLLYQPRVADPPNEPALVHTTGPPEKTMRRGDSLAPSSRSNSSISIGQEQRATEFLNDLKIQSVGAVQDAGTDDFDSDRNTIKVEQGQLDTVIRTRYSRHINLQKPTSSLRPMDIATDAEMALNLTLSVSDGEDSKGEEGPLDWEQQPSTDDEKMAALRRRNRRQSSGKAVTGSHRRTRSGDAAAATLMTGGPNWKGMLADHLLIPLSLQEQDDEEEENDTAEELNLAPSQIRQSSSFGQAGTRWSRKPQSERPAKDGNEGFSVGSYGISHKQRKGRKPPRNRRTLSQDGIPDWGQSSMNFGEAQHLSPDQHHISSSSIPLLVGRSPGQPTDDASMSTLEGYGIETPLVWNQYGTSFGEHMPPIHISRTRPVYKDTTSGRHIRSSPTGNFPSQMSERLGDFGARAPSEGSVSSKESVFSWISRLLESKAKSSPQLHQPQHIHGLKTRPLSAADLGSGGGPDTDYSNSEDEHIDVFANQLHVVSGRDLNSTEMLFENKGFRGPAQNVLRERIVDSPFGFFGKKGQSPDNFKSRASFKPITNVVTDENTKDYATFVCARCGTRQREFFTVASVGNQFQSPAGYLALYFTVYVAASLYIFGLDEGWSSLDCVYFAVITLTTAGLGDFVPTNDASKIICSIFIYFGVASIGLLLGSYLAGIMDEKSLQQAQENRLNNCVSCSRVNSLKALEKRRNVIHGSSREFESSAPKLSAGMFQSERVAARGDNSGFAKELATLSAIKRAKKNHFSASATAGDNVAAPAVLGGGNAPQIMSGRSSELAYDDVQRFGNSSVPNLGVINSYASQSTPLPSPPSPVLPIDPMSPRSHPLLGSPMTAQILNRQSHTRHESLDASSRTAPGSAPRPRKYSVDTPSMQPSACRETNHSQQFNGIAPPPSAVHWSECEESNIDHEEDEDDDSSQITETSTATDASDMMRPPSKLKAAKYVFLTLKQALLNSTLIIAIGSAGFYYIEKMTLVDAFYFTTVLLTTVGYGDITPETSAGKLFATVYVLVAGTVLLHNMSLISMIPLELRKRRLERAVLTQFGDQLDDAALRELATGPLVKRLQLSIQRPDGLDECTREMFALAMLVRLGKVTERDIRQTFSAFRCLDVDNDGVLNSRTIIAGMMQKRRSRVNLSAMTDFTEDDESHCNPQPDPPPPPPHEQVPPPLFLLPEVGTSAGEDRFGECGSLNVRRQGSRYPHYSEPGHLASPLNAEHVSLLNNTTNYGSYTPAPANCHRNQEVNDETGIYI